MALLAAAALGWPAAAGADCLGDTPSTGGGPTPKPGGRPLEFGIYPGGTAGQIVVPASPTPEDPAKTLAALHRLRHAGGPFTVHIYRSYTGTASDAKEETEQRRLVKLYTSHGLGVEVVIRYRRDDAPAEFATFVRGVVRRFGGNRLVRGFQVTNEVNFTASADSSDGAYAGARDALIQGVIAAKREARMRGYSQIRIGFNWFYRTDPGNEDGFWQYLGAHGGKDFVRSLDWVGLDVYPGTFFPPTVPPGSTGDFVVNALSQMRQCFLHEANIPKTVPIHIEENGYPTGPGRSYADQRAALHSMVGAASTYRANYNVTQYFWFDLRDADSASPNFQQQYGLMRDDYTPKPAFGSYRSLVSRLSLRDPVLTARCYRRGVYAQVHNRNSGKIESVTFHARGKTAHDTTPPWSRHIELPPTEKQINIEVRATTNLSNRTAQARKAVQCHIDE